MKSILILLSAGMLFSCGKSLDQPTRSVSVAVIVDTTDYRNIIPEADPLLELYRFDTALYTEAYFRLTTITDKSISPVSESYLESGEKTEKRNTRGIPHFREGNISLFYETVRSCFHDFQNLDTALTLKHSECYRVIVQELTYLMNQPFSNEKILVVFSDLMENSDIVSFYDDESFAKITRDPQDLQNSFGIAQPLPGSLLGVRVYFVFQPRTREEDLQYRKVSSFFKTMLEEKGAIVTIQAHNQSYN
jgi:hypothetical protein